MPIYEFECSDCRQTFEVRRCFSDAELPVKCVKCESLNTRRLLSKFYAKSTDNPSLSSAGHSGCGNCHGGSCGSCHH
ncbi:MAG: zinc ribbon domain-containing protein [Leptolinea sp.]|nr:zinc ribbon domain-containing protein [Leptolinea sp.]